MKSGSRPSIAVLLILAVFAGMTGIVGCVTCPSWAGAPMPCCGSGGAPSLHPVSCCQPQVSERLAPPAPAITPPAAPAVLPAPADPLSAQPAPAPRTAELPLAPPPLHEGIGLYTLNATFLI
jgi:hypothetical protein